MGRHIRNVLNMTSGKVEGKGGAAELLGGAEAAIGGKNNPSGRKGKKVDKSLRASLHIKNKGILSCWRISHMERYAETKESPVNVPQ